MQVLWVSIFIVILVSCLLTKKQVSSPSAVNAEGEAICLNYKEPSA